MNIMLQNYMLMKDDIQKNTQQLLDDSEDDDEELPMTTTVKDQLSQLIMPSRGEESATKENP